jgi:hypothetical protein
MTQGFETERAGERFADSDAVDILLGLERLEWKPDTESRTDYHRAPVVSSVIDAIDGIEYTLQTDGKYLELGEIQSYHEIPTLMYPDGMKRSWQVIPLLRLTRAENPTGAYFLFPNFAHGFDYQQGRGLRPRYVGHTTGHDGVKDVPLDVHRGVIGQEERDLKAQINRLLAIN